MTKHENGNLYTETDEYYTFIIVVDGNLKTPDLSIFNKWHQLKIIYLDGRVIKDQSNDNYIKNGYDILSLGMTGGSRRISTTTIESSGDYDGATIKWEIRKE